MDCESEGGRAVDLIWFRECECVIVFSAGNGGQCMRFHRCSACMLAKNDVSSYLKPKYRHKCTPRVSKSKRK